MKKYKIRCMVKKKEFTKHDFDALFEYVTLNA